jgi:hypothetical protein
MATGFRPFDSRTDQPRTALPACVISKRFLAASDAGSEAIVGSAGEECSMTQRTAWALIAV